MSDEQLPANSLDVALDEHALFLRSEGREGNLGDFSGQSFVGRSLVGYDFSGSKCVGASFYGANLMGTKWAGSNCFGATFYGANLAASDLSGGSFLGANMGAANLPNCRCILTNFRGANMYSTNLANCDLTKAIFSDSNLCGSSFKGCTVSGKKLKGVYTAARGFAKFGTESIVVLATTADRKDWWWFSGCVMGTEDVVVNEVERRYGSESHAALSSLQAIRYLVEMAQREAKPEAALPDSQGDKPILSLPLNGE